MAHVTIILLCSITLRFPHEFILLQVVAGMVAIYSLRELSQRSQLLRTALVVFISYALLYFAFELIHEDDLTKRNMRMYIYFIIERYLTAVRLSVTVPFGENIRFYFRCDFGGTVKYQQ